MYEYNANGTISSEKLYSRKESDPSIPVVDKSFSYNSNGQVSKVTSVSKYLPKPEYERYEYDDKGNTQKIYSSKDGVNEYLSSEFISYDDHKNIFENQPFYHGTLISFGGVADVTSYLRVLTTKNNPLIIKYYTESGTATTTTTTLSYTYNESGYPTQVSGISNPSTFEYDCQ